MFQLTRTYKFAVIKSFFSMRAHVIRFGKKFYDNNLPPHVRAGGLSTLDFYGVYLHFVDFFDGIPKERNLETKSLKPALPTNAPMRILISIISIQDLGRMMGNINAIAKP